MTLTNPELAFLALTALATALMWIPHIGQLIWQEGLARAVWDPARKTEHDAAWARRARRAHLNAVENMAVFAPLALAVVLTGAGTETTAWAAAGVFLARLGHFAAYTFAIPGLRVLFFLAGWVCLLILATPLIGAVL